MFVVCLIKENVFMIILVFISCLVFEVILGGDVMFGIEFLLKL